MQSYGEYQLIPRKSANSSPTCMDNRTNSGQIDEFLSKYFNMYEYYAAHKAENADGPNYVDYDQMLEDEQSDDLTLLAIKRI